MNFGETQTLTSDMNHEPWTKEKIKKRVEQLKFQIIWGKLSEEIFLNILKETPVLPRHFVESIVIKEDFDDPKERARRALEKKRKQKEEELAKQKQLMSMTTFNEEDIKLLVKQVLAELKLDNFWYF